ncbi:hypothetical protein MTR67_033190 [Solanum verrucosum]|uniref:Uncharacterized protein n=1 Tax=Solanum verrucosum TaxID=315347 RepID=A0AAF0U5L3_SOLVR|nr:hypothetical protein MTR67_033190 [Solanum verrucosum]
MYSGSSTCALLIPHVVRVSYVSQDEGSLGDQQWFSSAGHVQGIDSNRDSMKAKGFKKKLFREKSLDIA